MPANKAAEEGVTGVYFKSRPALHRYLTLSTHCPHTASDLLQEIYLRLPLLKPIPDSETAIRAWLFRVAANLVADHFRKERRHNEILAGHLPSYDGRSLAPALEEALHHKAQLAYIQTAIQELPKVCVDVLYLSRIEGMTHQAIADRLDISKSWVEKQLVRALNHLRSKISDD